MATFTKAIPLIFNKAFLLSLEEPSEEIRNINNFLYSGDDHDISSDNSNNKFNNKVISYFLGTDNAIKYLSNASIQYNDLFPKERCEIETDSTKFINFDPELDDIDKINNFLINPVIL